MQSLGTTWRALREQMVRDPMSPERVAAGWALGMFIGCSIPFGLQLIVSVPLSFLLKVSKIGATVGTLITNPVSIFFIYPVQIWMGGRLIGHPFTWEYIHDVTAKLAHVSLLSADGWRTLSEISGRVLGGFFAGGLLFAFVCTPLTYWSVRRIIIKYRALRLRRGR